MTDTKMKTAEELAKVIAEYETRAAMRGLNLRHPSMLVHIAEEIRAIQLDARNAALEEAAEIASNGHLVSSGCAYGTQTDIIKAILAARKETTK